MDYVKPSIKAIKPYVVNKTPYKIKLDANESTSHLFESELKIDEILSINVYPDGEAFNLRCALSQYIEVPPCHIMVGNGSSELIEMLFKTFVDKGETVLNFVPSFSMYQIYCQIYQANYETISCEADFSVNINLLIKKAKQINPKIILLCNPNNPTGYLIRKEEIKRVLTETDALVVVDEAYMDFAEESIIKEYNQYSNLIVLRTISKAFGLAGIRLGYMVANSELINYVNRVRPPYNVNTITQYVGIKAINQKEKVYQYIEKIKKEREKMYQGLSDLNINVFKSHANFIFFECKIEDFYEQLIEKGVIIRAFGDGYYRVSIGNKYENETFLSCVKEIVSDEKCCTRT